jgi:hypothetical protein
MAGSLGRHLVTRLLPERITHRRIPHLTEVRITEIVDQVAAPVGDLADSGDDGGDPAGPNIPPTADQERADGSVAWVLKFISTRAGVAIQGPLASALCDRRADLGALRASAGFRHAGIMERKRRRFYRSCSVDCWRAAPGRTQPVEASFASRFAAARDPFSDLR